MFYTPKPRKFKYTPRFYDPEKERREALKQKYADEQAAAASAASAESDGSSDLAYFERRVRELDREKKRRLGWKDLVSKREMPKFNYEPRFATSEADAGESHAAQYKRRNTSIKRRFDVSDEDYMKPIPAGRIMLYALLVCLLLYWILF